MSIVSDCFSIVVWMNVTNSCKISMSKRVGEIKLFEHRSTDQFYFNHKFRAE